MTQECFSLQGSKKCAGLDQYAILQSENFKNTLELDQYLTNNQYSSPQSIDIFKTELQCTFDGKGVRYTDSTLCGFFITLSASKCQSQYNDPSAQFRFCSNTCDSHVESLQKILGNSTVCDPNVSPNVLEKRSLVTKSGTDFTNVNDFCAMLKSQPNTTCFRGIEADFAQCGFGTKEEAKMYCQGSGTDACCKEVWAASASPGADVLNPANNAFIISGIVAACLVLLGFVFYVFQKVSKSRQRPTTAYRQSKFQSRMFSLYKDDVSKPPLPAVTTTVGPKPRASLFTTIVQVPNPLDISILATSFQSRKLSGNPKQLVVGEVKLQVVEDYDAGMDDEMSCTVGDILLVLEEFDDGWAMGQNQSTGDQGVFPLAICEQVGIKRHQSVYSLGKESYHHIV